jgi:hypothetical protein
MTYHSPQDALELENEFWVFLLVTVLTDEEGKLREITLFMEGLAPKLCLCHLPKKMGWDYAIERPKSEL